jgi:hypothetical protein
MKEMFDKMKSVVKESGMNVTDINDSSTEIRFKLSSSSVKDFPPGIDFLKFQDYFKNQIQSDIGCVYKESNGIFSLDTFILDQDNQLAIQTLERYGKIRAFTKISFLNMFRILMDNLLVRSIQLPN